MQEEKFMEIYQNTNGTSESYVDVVNKNGRIYKRFFSTVKFQNEWELDRFFEKIVIDDNCQMIRNNKICSVFEDRKTGETKYYVYRNELRIEKVVMQEIEKISKNEIAEKICINY